MKCILHFYKKSKPREAMRENYHGKIKVRSNQIVYIFRLKILVLYE